MDSLQDSYIFRKILFPVLTFFIDVFQGILFIMASGEAYVRELYVKIFQCTCANFNTATIK